MSATEVDTRDLRRTQQQERVRSAADTYAHLATQGVVAAALASYTAHKAAGVPHPCPQIAAAIEMWLDARAGLLPEETDR